jgi:hypothetical protein
MPGSGGVAYMFSFKVGGEYAPCWVYNINTTLVDAGISASHEIGHTLGLNHDGSPGYEYYAGQGIWTPLMGAGFGKTLHQWSKGEYAGATNKEDDVNIIATANGFPYRIEPGNNTMATAQTINPARYAGTVNYWISGVIRKANEVDYYKIDVDGQLSLYFTGNLPSYPNLNMSVKLIKSDSITVVKSWIGTSGVSVNLPRGTYYVAIDGVGDKDPLTTGYSDYGSLGGYGLTIAGYYCETVNEPNDAQYIAAPFSLNSSINAAIIPNDIDYYKIEVSSSGTDYELNVALTGLTADIDMQLFNSGGTLVASSALGGTSNEFISVVQPIVGTYYLKLYGYNGAITSNCYTLNNEYKYNPCPSSNEPNESTAAATNLVLQNSIQGAITSSTDVDYYKIVFPMAGMLTLNLSDLYVDIDLQLLNSSFTQVASSANGGTSNEAITYAVPVAGTYYIKVFGYNGVNSRRCYTLMNTAAFPCTNAYEPNETQSKATDFPLNSALQAGYSSTSDLDSYRIVVPGSGSLTFTYNNTLTTTASFGLYDYTGYAFRSASLPGSTTTTLTYTVAGPAIYYVVLNHPGQVPATPCYTITNSFIQQTCVSFEPNESLAGAVRLPYNGYIQTNFISASDVDCFSYSLRYGASKITISDITVPTSVVIYDPFNVEIKRDDNTTLGAKTINFAVNNSGDYKILLKPLATPTSGCYKLEQIYYPGMESSAVQFNGTEQVALIPAHPKMTLACPYSIEIMSKLNTVAGSGANEWLFGNADAQLTITRSATLTGSDLIDYQSTCGNISYSLNLKDGKCHQLAIVKSTSAISLYIDGQLAKQQTENSIGFAGNATLPWCLGSTNTTAGNYTRFQSSLKGILKEFRTWNYARSQTEIQDKMNSALAGNEAGLIGYWPLSLSGEFHSIYDLSTSSANPANGYMGYDLTKNFDPEYLFNGTCVAVNTQRLESDTEAGNSDLSDGLSVYPNPFTTELNFKLADSGSDNYTAELINALGEVIYKESSIVSGKEYNIKNTFPAGFYILKVYNGSVEKMKKVVK